MRIEARLHPPSAKHPSGLLLGNRAGSGGSGLGQRRERTLLLSCWATADGPSRPRVSLRKFVWRFGQDADMVGSVRPPEVRPAVRRQRPKRLVVRQHHTQHCGVVHAAPLAEMARGDPSRTGEHGATSHLLRQDDVLEPDHEPPPLAARVLAPGVSSPSWGGIVSSTNGRAVMRRVYRTSVRATTRISTQPAVRPRGRARWRPLELPSGTVVGSPRKSSMDEQGELIETKRLRAADGKLRDHQPRRDQPR